MTGLKSENLALKESIFLSSYIMRYAFGGSAIKTGNILHCRNSLAMFLSSFSNIVMSAKTFGKNVLSSIRFLNAVKFKASHAKSCAYLVVVHRFGNLFIASSKQFSVKSTLQLRWPYSAAAIGVYQIEQYSQTKSISTVIDID